MVGERRFELPLRPAHQLAGVAKSRFLFVATPPSWPRYVRDQGRIRTETGLEKAWSGRGDLNSRPLGPEPSALPGCATPRFLGNDMTMFMSRVRKFPFTIQDFAWNVQNFNQDPGRLTTSEGVS